MLVIIVIVFACCFALERLVPGWSMPRVKTWPLRVLTINAVQMGVVLLAGATWERWLASWSALHLSRHMGPSAGGLIAYFIATFVFYWWHRWRHEVHWLWLGFHQIHHSPQRIEVITGGERRRRWSVEEKQAIVAESLEPNVSIAGVARKHGIGTGQLYGWRHQFLTDRPNKMTSFARVELLSEPRHLAGRIMPSPGLIEIVLAGGATIRVDAQVDERALRRVLAVLRG